MKLTSQGIELTLQMSIDIAQQQNLTSLSTKGEWVPLLEYAVRHGLSMSTMRRYIKAGKLIHRLEGGKYLVFDSTSNSAEKKNSRSSHSASHSSVTEQSQGEYSVSQFKKLQADALLLKDELRKAKEEISELKMLVAFYEEDQSHQSNNQ